MNRTIGLAVAAGAAMGLYLWITSTWPWTAVIGGVLTAVLSTLALWRSWGAEALAPLTFEQRQHVLRTLRRGEAMNDPQLASAHWQHGNAILARSSPAPAFVYIAFGILAVVIIVIAVTGFADAPLKVLVGMAVTIVAPFVFLPWHSRYRKQVARSIQATRASSPWR